ncbi:MAG: hypothetical protein K2N87_08700 [Eubacterium sp.]|nr:hypothetical protein [Eubacterium sp.]
MNRHKKATLLGRLIAMISCFALITAAMSPITALADSKVELALKYNGKTVVVEKLAADDMDLDVLTGCSQASYKKIKKAFGDAKKYETDGGTAYEYKDKGFLFVMEPQIGSTDMCSLRIEITSKKAALNGIKVGMAYSDVKKKLETKYGKSRVMTQEDKKDIMLTYGPFMPIFYSFKNGKVNNISFFHS